MQQKWNQNFDGEPMTDIPAEVSERRVRCLYGDAATA